MEKWLDKFDGRSEEKAQSWLSNFKTYVAFKGYDDVTTKHFLPLCLSDIAFDWFYTLPDTVTNNIDSLYAAFQERFFTPAVLNYVTATSLFHTYQQPDESVLSFITKIKLMAKKIDIPDNILCYALLNGLRPQLCTFVLRNANPINIDNIEHLSRLCELTETNEDQIIMNIAKIEKEMDKLKQKVEHMVTEIERRSEKQYQQQQSMNSCCIISHGRQQQLHSINRFRTV